MLSWVHGIRSDGVLRNLECGAHRTAGVWTREVGESRGHARGGQNVPPALAEGVRRLLEVIRRGSVRRAQSEAPNRGSD